MTYLFLTGFCSFAMGQDTIPDTLNIPLESIDTVHAEFEQINQEAEKLYNRGISKFQKGAFESALNDFTEALKVKPDFEKAFFNKSI